MGGDEEFPEDFDTSTTESTTTTTMSAPTTVGVTYEGDFETVDDHRAHETTPRTTQATVPPSSAPDICDGHFDAVATLRNELFIFKGAVSDLVLLLVVRIASRPKIARLELF